MAERRRDFAAIGTELLMLHHPAAACGFVCGSILRGQDTPSSDIDLVVLYNDTTSTSFRTTIRYADWVVEIFVHNLRTNTSFLESDCQSGWPHMADMLANGLVIGPDPALGYARQNLARGMLEKGPPVWDKNKIDYQRYSITDTLDDLRHPHDPDYRVGISSDLFHKLADFHFRAAGKWSGHGKALVRLLKADNPVLAANLLNAFHAALKGDITPIEDVTATILKPYGGFLQDGFYSVASDK